MALTARSLGLLILALMAGLFLIIAGALCLDHELKREQDAAESVKVVTITEIVVGSLLLIAVAIVGKIKFVGDSN